MSTITGQTKLLVKKYPHITPIVKEMELDDTEEIVLYMKKNTTEVFRKGKTKVECIHEDSEEEEEEVESPKPKQKSTSKSPYTLPPLYCIDAKGKKRIWKVWVIEDTVHKS